VGCPKRMKNLNGIHHISAITADATRNLQFYVGVMGLRLVKKTVNQDDPTVYHLFYADEDGSPGADLTFFEYPGLERGRAGAGMIHRIALRVGSPEALAFWAGRLSEAGLDSTLDDERLRFADPEGLGFELIVAPTSDRPLVAHHPEIPEQFALQGFAGVRAYESTRGIGGAGTVHHVAWSSTMEEHVAWRDRVIDGGGTPTPVIDRFYFHSIYFREPSGVLFEIATIGPGFATDESREHLGERLSLPPAFEYLRDQVEANLVPLPVLRA
jgi:glyoxalase family protein